MQRRGEVVVIVNKAVAIVKVFLRRTRNLLLIYTHRQVTLISFLTKLQALARAHKSANMTFSHHI